MKTASLIAKSNGNYLLQVRDVVVDGQMRGKYPFVFPGTSSLFGGKVEDGEIPEEAFRREIKEELPGLKLTEELDHRVYFWKNQLDIIIRRINDYR